MSSNGVFTTIINLKKGKYEWSFSFSAIDGSLHEIKLYSGNISYIIVAVVEGRVDKDGFSISRINYREKLCEDCKPEDEMRKMEYDEAMKETTDIVFLDRKISTDGFYKDNVIAVIKDPSERVEVDAETPWILPIKEDKVKSAYFKLYPFSWVFLVETTLNKEWKEILSILQALGREPVPEALGYNYPLYLADKVAKFYRDKKMKELDFVISKFPQRYRQFRSIVEKNRKK